MPKQPWNEERRRRIWRPSVGEANRGPATGNRFLLANQVSASTATPAIAGNSRDDHGAKNVDSREQVLLAEAPAQITGDKRCRRMLNKPINARAVAPTAGVILHVQEVRRRCTEMKAT